MTFKIHFTVRDASGDEHEECISVSGETVEDISMTAHAEVAKRGGYDPWSEEAA